MIILVKKKLIKHIIKSVVVFFMEYIGIEKIIGDIMVDAGEWYDLQTPGNGVGYVY